MTRIGCFAKVSARPDRGERRVPVWVFGLASALLATSCGRSADELKPGGGETAAVAEQAAKLEGVVPAASPGGCVKEESGFHAVPICTSNDVSLSGIVPGSLVILDDGCTSPSDTVTFTARGIFQITTNQRFDIGIFISTDNDPDGNGAKAG